MQATTQHVPSDVLSRAAVPRTIALSPIEQVFTGAGAYPVSFGFSFAAPLDAAVLQSSLAVTLRSFATLQCRLVEDGPRGVALRRDAAVGALRVSSAELDRAGMREAIVDGRIGSETARFTLSREGAGSRLTVSISHAVVDGFSFMQFMYAWARVARGLPLPPVVRERLEDGSSEGAVSAERVRADSGALWLEGRKRAEHVTLRSVRRRFSHDDLARERAEARASRGSNLTDNDLICAHLWQQFAPRDTSPDAEAFLTCPVDVRPLCPKLGRAHFGCAVTFATTALSARELASSHAADVAAQIRKAVGAVDAQRVLASLRTLAALRAQRGSGALDEVHLTHPERGLLVTNLTRLPLSGLDFGTGAPSELEPIVQLPRCVVLFSCPGGVEARVYLPA